MTDTTSTSSPAPRSRRRGGPRLIPLIGAALTVAAVAGELRKPKADRTWTGSVAGFVPYDFRRPTLERVRLRMWNPDDHRVVVPRVFGVGWTINACSLVRRLKAFAAERRH